MIRLTALIVFAFAALAHADPFPRELRRYNGGNGGKGSNSTSVCPIEDTEDLLGAMGEITACVATSPSKKKSSKSKGSSSSGSCGSLRLITPTEECMEGEVELVFNQVGPEGPPGLNGTDGADGAPGLNGTDGADGAPGPVQTSRIAFSPGREDFNGNVCNQRPTGGCRSVAECPTGYVAVGGGYRVSLDDDDADPGDAFPPITGLDVDVQASFPTRPSGSAATDPPNGWRVEAVVFNNDPADTREIVLRAYAVCLEVPSP